MKIARKLAPVLALLIMAPVAVHAEPGPVRAASIPFANQNGVRDWVVEGDRTIYFQDNGRRWYRATLFAPNVDLPFVQAIGLDTGPIGRLDRWSTLIVRGQRVPISTFEQVDGLPARQAKADKS